MAFSPPVSRQAGRKGFIAARRASRSPSRRRRSARRSCALPASRGASGRRPRRSVSRRGRAPPPEARARAGRRDRGRGSRNRTRSRRSSLSAAPCAVERRALALHRGDFGEIGFERLRRALDRAGDVEALDIAAPLPDRVDRRLAIEARHRAVLHHPRAAEAFQRLVGVARRALADPVFADRGADATSASSWASSR